jgi:hypothetical protein
MTKWTPEDLKFKGYDTDGKRINKPKARKPRKTHYYNGVKYRSEDEVRYAAHLDWQVMAGDIVDWEYESIVLDIAPNLKKRRTYKPDFVVEKVYIDKSCGNVFKDGMVGDVSLPKGVWKHKPYFEIHEVKGWGKCRYCHKPNSEYREKGIARFENAANLYCKEYDFVLVEWKDKAWKLTRYGEK